MRCERRCFYVLGVIVACILLAAPFGMAGEEEGSPIPEIAEEKVDSLEEIQLLFEIIELIDAHYVEEVDRDELLRGAVEGLLDSLKDPYTSYLTPEDYEDLQIQTRGTFSGIGIEVTPDEETGEVIVVSPIKGTPGEEAGLKTGDRIISVDGKPTSKMDFRKSVEMMRGEEGTLVELIVEREDLEEPLTLEIERAFIEIPNITSELKREDIGYIRVNVFNEGTGLELAREIEGLEAEVGLRGIILDLRSNPGGILPEAISVASNFVDEGVVVKIKNREGVQQSLQTDPGIRAVDHPLVVLVDQGSASASEIVAGALQDYSRGIILGVQTFGKGSVQNVAPLSHDRGALSLTVANYYTPSGRNIHEEGIRPDIVVEFDAEDEEDVQLEGALDLLEVLDRVRWKVEPEPEPEGEEAA